MVKIEISNRAMYSVLAVFIVVLLAIGVYAVAPNPGHDSSQINFSTRIGMGLAIPISTSQLRVIDDCSGIGCEGHRAIEGIIGGEYGKGVYGEGFYGVYGKSQDSLGYGIYSEGQAQITGALKLDGALKLGVSPYQIDGGNHVCNSANLGTFLHVKQGVGVTITDDGLGSAVSYTIPGLLFCTQKLTGSYSWHKVNLTAIV